MINQQLLDFIKSQLLEGLDKEAITKELIGNGWTEQDIGESFNTVNTQLQVPQNVPVPSGSKLTDTTTQIKPKRHIFRKIIKVIIIIWICLEVINAGAYFYQLNQPVVPNPYVMPYGPHKYRPAVIQIAYIIVPSLNPNYGINYKPVIYLYPTQTKKVKVELDYKGKLIADYPAYDYSTKGWDVTAYPDGKIINKDGKEYSYLFWEGEPTAPINYDLSSGFVVKGKDTVKFLQDTLSSMGLTPKEYNEFIVYWYPKMKDNKYNLIHFADKQYTYTAPLTITPTPDSMLRVFMVFKPLDKTIEVKSQEIKSFNRTGFSVIEWGGIELKK